MPKSLCTFLALIFFLSAGASSRADIVDQYEEAKQSGEKTLAEFFAGNDHADDPQFYSLKSQYLWTQANKIGVAILPKPAGKEGIAITSLDGKLVGSIQPAGPNAKLAAETIETIREAIRRFPNRLDFRIGLADTHQALKQYDEMFAVYTAACEHIKKNPKAQLEGRDGPAKSGLYDVIKVKAGEALGGSMQRHCRLFWSMENETGDHNMQRLAELSAGNFPDRPEAWNMLAAYHSFKKDRDSALDCLQNALKAAPDDEIVLSNIAKLSKDMGKKEEASNYYRQLIKTTQSAERKAQAEAALKALQADKKASAKSE